MVEKRAGRKFAKEKTCFSTLRSAAPALLQNSHNLSEKPTFQNKKRSVELKVQRYLEVAMFQEPPNNGPEGGWEVIGLGAKCSRWFWDVGFRVWGLGLHALGRP